MTTGSDHGSTVGFDSHGVRCEGTWFPATGAGDAGRRPCVVMGHGFGGTRDTGLEPFARRFAAAGLHVLTFDYRGFGTSGGGPRQDVDHRRHREDYHAALAHVRDRPDVDADRVAIWGSSYSGGHVIAVAAADPRVRAVISQGAAMDGLAAMRLDLRTGGLGKGSRLVAAGIRDQAGTAVGRPPYEIPIVGPPGSTAALTSPGSLEGYLAIAGSTFVNRMPARGVLRIARNRPVATADRVRCPTLLVVAEGDNLAPPESVREVARRIGSAAEVLSLDCGHFDIYVGEPFETSVARQVEFLSRSLA